MSTRSRLENAAEALRAAYGTPELPRAASGWSLFLQLLLIGPAQDVGPAVRNALDSDALSSPRVVSQTSAGQLVEQLAGVPRGPQKASLLRSVATWWLETFGDDCSPEWVGGADRYRESLLKIRGLGLATVDELLLFAGGLDLFPLDRGIVRVAVRHGWLDLPLEDDEAQHVFAGGLKETDVDLREFVLLLGRVATEHCRREPICEGCPLQPLLPPNGPLNPDSC
ncbi:hypothetical protein [Schlesneria paludicola]|uniref:hypothetical protein n=1 Tax=Schlesneria paludicola TaxID=360056 RepID=UPI00029A7DE7|nr:hypothetical protein [Schlesneria paludicola]